MIFAKTANESTYFSAFNHRLKFWTLNFSSPQLLQKTFVPYGFLFNNVYLHVCYHPSTPSTITTSPHLCQSGSKTPCIYVYIYIHNIDLLLMKKGNIFRFVQCLFLACAGIVSKIQTINTKNVFTVELLQRPTPERMEHVFQVQTHFY